MRAPAAGFTLCPCTKLPPSIGASGMATKGTETGVKSAMVLSFQHTTRLRGDARSLRAPTSVHGRTRSLARAQQALQEHPLCRVDLLARRLELEAASGVYFGKPL